MKRTFSLLFLCCILCTGCSEDEGSNSASEMSYNETKKMVLDILKTDEGKKAIAETMSDEKMQQMLVLDQNVVTTTIEKTMTSNEGEKFWEDSFQDPEFVANYAKGMEKEHMQLLKEMIKDPTYQQGLIEILQSPELQEEYLHLLTSPTSKKYLQSVIAESMETPTFESKMLDYVKKTTTEMTKPKPKE